MNVNKLRWLLPLISLFSLFGCSSNYAVLHLYDGPPRTLQDIAILTADRGLYLNSVDDKKVKYYNPNTTRIYYYLKPGIHKFQANYHGSFYDPDIYNDMLAVTSIEPIIISAELKAGHMYHWQCGVEPNTTVVVGEKVRLNSSIEYWGSTESYITSRLSVGFSMQNDWYAFLMTRPLFDREYRRLQPCTIRPTTGFNWNCKWVKGRYDEYDISKGRYDSAISKLTLALSSENTNKAKAEIHIDRGVAYYRTGQIDKAVTDFTKAIGFCPECVLAYYNRGITYYNSGQSEIAKNDLYTAIKLKPKPLISDFAAKVIKLIQ